jgi:hypothetical protein
MGNCILQTAWAKRVEGEGQAWQKKRSVARSSWYGNVYSFVEVVPKSFNVSLFLAWEREG